MKATFTIILLVFWSANVLGQDLIITNSKEEIKAKVVEIDDLQVKYKKFDFQDGPVYAIKKAQVFLIIYSNGSRETFNQVVPDNGIPSPKTTKTATTTYREESTVPTQSATTSPTIQKEKSAPVESQPSGANQMLFKKGDQLFGLGLGTGIMLRNGFAGAVNLNIPYISARFDKVYTEIGPSMSIGGGLYASYQAYSIDLGFSDSYTSSEFSVGISGTFYYGISEKIALAAGLRLLYIGLSSSVSYTGTTAGGVGVGIFASGHYKASDKLNLFFELASGSSNINLGAQFRF